MCNSTTHTKKRGKGAALQCRTHPQQTVKQNMAEFLGDNPELQQFLLPNVRLTGVRIGAGAYGSVEEVAVPGAVCAAKKIHEVFLDRSEIPESEVRKSAA